ncbi:uncharacterized protein G2W53_029207 [Senna tora]|uniref:Uncharacterized protein n=1 Tax=Senna tora TaxID=362788 RepID=A0A834WBL2_9FABA|nr:uncharacterized protein G2W53_029207 [Senna tora]
MDKGVETRPKSIDKPNSSRKAPERDKRERRPPIWAKDYQM